MNEVNELCGKIIGIVNDLESDIRKVKGLIDLYDVFALSEENNPSDSGFTAEAFYSLRDFGYILYSGMIEKSERICEAMREY